MTAAPKTKLRLVILALTLATAGGTLALWRNNQSAAPTAKAPMPIPVTAALAEQGDMPILLSLVGRAEAYEGVTLKSRIDGQVQSVAYTEGQSVSKGEVLVQLDPGDFNARMAQAQALVARDQAQLAKQEADVERYTGLKAKGFVSDEKVNEVRTNAAAARATLAADQAALELARLQAGYTTIRAPFSGVVGARLVFPGSAVKTNDTALAVVNRISPLYVSFGVPERHLGRLREAVKNGAMPVSITLPGNTGTLAGSARFIDNTVDAATGTVQMKAVLENRDGRLTPGQFANVGMVLDTLTQATLIPNEAVQQGAEGNFLYVIRADETVEMRRIEVLASLEGRSAIGKGLAAGEKVVTDGHLRLMPGAAIKIKAPGKGKEGGKEAAPAAAPRQG